MTTTTPTCQHQWVNRSSMGDPWRECSLCGKQEDVEVRRPDLGWDLIESDISPLDALSEDEFRRHQRYGVQPRRTPSLLDRLNAVLDAIVKPWGDHGAR